MPGLTMPLVRLSKDQHQAPLKCSVSLLPTSDISQSQQKNAEQLLSAYSDVFSSSSEDIGKTESAFHQITTTSDVPIYQRAYRTSPAMRLEIQSQVDELLRRGIIEKSYSPWASPIVMVRKKGQDISILCRLQSLECSDCQGLAPNSQAR